jgi:Arc/MetJ-type ribon-helix-helix transcriptional regulator
MNIALTEQSESFVLKKLGAGEFASAEAVVERALDAWQAREMFSSIDDDALKKSLLEAVRSPLRPYRPGQFVEMVEKLIAERQRE